jgi:hypothetical protein
MAVSPRSSKVGLNIATSGSWGTSTAVATALGAGDGVWVTDDLNITLSMQVDEDDSAGQDFIGSMQVANHNPIKATIPCFLHYHDTFQNPLWALALGTGGTAGSPNTFEPATNKTGKYATIVRDKVQFISEANGKCSGFDLSFGDNGRAEIKWKFICDKEKVDSTINTATQVSALTFPTQGLRAFFKQLTFRVNLQSGGALAAGDAVKVTDLKLTYEQKMDELLVAGQDSIIEPEEDAYPEIGIEWTFARLDSASDDYIGYHRDNTSLKADMTFVGPSIGTFATAMLFQFPNLIVREAPVEFKASAKNVHPTVKVGAYKAASAPTGMTGVTKPFRLTTTGISTANPFA